MHLVHYARAILAGEIAHCDKKTEAWRDQGFDVERETASYRFDDGVVIRRTVERDRFPSELACAECWITYEVLTQGAETVIPANKTFGNACRETFWLRYHLAGD
ncbi:MAG: hypothetical protein JO171_01800 [Paludibacterium sp.]|uniref:hypothetical protein n=1 Tax=Paludibacterium sp. TaxID=1917523 RepID=UPI0025F7C02A|nr:hypothetical protein [Paludibacterium sp.]MBV8045860.1 hypothetical protein [Paludibacterium sp.]MBV8646780.1 hypothetical protein [Paludibacterium sp.]